MAEIGFDLRSRQPFRDAVARVIERMYGTRTGRAVLESIGDFDPGYRTEIVIREAATPSSPPPGDGSTPSLDRLLERSRGGSGIGHTMTRRTVPEADTATEEERAWLRLRGQAPPRQLAPTGRITSQSVPIDFDLASVSPGAELLHELVHALRTLDGSRLAASRNSGPTGYDNHEEFYAVVFENVFRSETGAELRKGYGGIDPVFGAVERRMSMRTGEPRGALTGDLSPFPSAPTDEDIAWATAQFTTAHAGLLNTLRTQDANLFTRVAQIPATTAAFNPIRVFVSRTNRRRR